MIKTTALALLLIVAFSSSYAQGNLKLPIKAEFNNDLIFITLPSEYQTPEFLPMAKPGMVYIMFTKKIQEYNPSKKEMIGILQQSLAVEPAETSKEVIYDYLASTVLYIFLNKSSSELPTLTLTLIDKWAHSDVGLEKEIKLVKGYISFGDGRK